jgi:hypothetical protein
LYVGTPSARTMTRSSISWLAIVIGPLTRSSHGHDARRRIAEADHRRDARGTGGSDLPGLGTPAAVVERLLAARALRLAHRLELGRGRVAAVRLAFGEQPLGDLASSGRGRCIWKIGPSSWSRPSQRIDARICSTDASLERATSVSSMRRMKSPP